MKKELYNPRNNKYTISDNIDYDRCMDFYLSKDNSVLKEYLETEKENDTITDEEIEFWEDAMECDIVQSICRTAIVESHEEDRKKDPVKVKLARELFRAGVEDVEKAPQQRQEEELEDAFKKVYVLGYTLKEIIVQKLKNKDKSVQEILDNIDSEKIDQKADNLFNKMKTVIENLKGISQNEEINSQGNKIVDYYKLQFLGKNAGIIIDYDETQMEKYTREYMQKRLYKSVNMSEISQSKEIIKVLVEEQEKNKYSKDAKEEGEVK